MTIYGITRAIGFSLLVGLSIMNPVHTEVVESVRAGDDANSCAGQFEKREESHRINNRGVAQLEQFNPADAVKEFRRSLSVCPDLKLAQVNLAIALLNAQDMDGAREAAEKAMQGAPEILHTHYILGLIARNHNRIENDLAAFKRVLASDPTDVR